MRRFSWILFLLLLVMTVSYLVATTGRMPDRVASHFGANNLANDWMTREGYLKFMLVFGALLPLGTTALVALLPRFAARTVNIPNRNYWFDPSRREETLAFLATHAAWLGCLLCAFIAGLHWTLLIANATTPARLPPGPFWTVVALFVGGTIAWTAVLARRFRGGR